MHPTNDDEVDQGNATKILSHPVRSRIIDLLASKGPLSWKQLSNELGVKTGALYYHLDALEKLVEQDADKRYVLTKKGREIHDYLERDPAQDSKGLEGVMNRGRVPDWLKGIFVPRSLIFLMTADRSRSLISVLAVCSATLAALALSGSELVLYSFSPAGGSLMLVGAYAASLAVLVLLSVASLRLVYGRRANPLVILVASAVSLLPLAAFSVVVSYFGVALTTRILLNSIGTTLVFVILQAWGAGVVAAGMSVASGLRIEKTLVISLALLYATMLIIFAQGGTLA